MTPTPGRRVLGSDQPLAVFLIGLRINRWHRPDAWGPALAAMGPMLTELYRDPESGFLSHRTTLTARGPLMVQYWRSAADVMRYARAQDQAHRPAWQAFYARARRAPGAVGIWHELLRRGWRREPCHLRGHALARARPGRGPARARPCSADPSPLTHDRGGTFLTVGRPLRGHTVEMWPIPGGR